MESLFLCYACGSLECSSIDIDLCTRCCRRYCRAHRRRHPCDDTESLPWPAGASDNPNSPIDATAMG
jgi:hypothetical protein